MTKTFSFLCAVLLLVEATTSCAHKVAPQGPDLAFSPSGTLTVQRAPGGEGAVVEVTISRTKDLRSSVRLTLGVDETFPPEGDTFMQPEWYDLPRRVELASTRSSVAFTVTLSPEVFESLDGGGRGGRILPIFIRECSPRADLDREKTRLVIRVEQASGETGWKLLPNGDFSTPVDLSKNWGSRGAVAGECHYTGGWNTPAAIVKYEAAGGLGGSPCVSIAAKEGSTTDVTICQVLEGFDPDKSYKVRARIRTEGITRGRGANLAEGNDLSPPRRGSPRRRVGAPPSSSCPTTTMVEWSLP